MKKSRKSVRRRKSHRRSKNWIAMWIASFFKGGKVLAGRCASVLF